MIPDCQLCLQVLNLSQQLFLLVSQRLNSPGSMLILLLNFKALPDSVLDFEGLLLEHLELLHQLPILYYLMVQLRIHFTQLTLPHV